MNIKNIWHKAFGVDFEIDKDVLDEFVAWNNSQWNKNGRSENGYCFINFIMITKELSLMLPKILYAKAIEKEMGVVPIILDWGSNPKLKKLYRSFGIQSINLHKHMALNLGGIIQSFGIMQKCKHMTGLELQGLIVDGVCIGRNIYGDVLRSTSLSTIRKVDNKVCQRKIFTLSLFADTMYKLTQKYIPKVCISDDWAYNEGIVLEYMNQAQAYIIQINLRRENILTTGKAKFERYRHSEMRTQIINYMNTHPFIDEGAVDLYLQRRFEGKNCSFRDKVAFQGKRNITREEWNVSMGLDPKKKNVVIMCHTFSDAVFNSEYSIFRDYYDWTEQTMQLISHMDHVNWIIKPHPSRANYNEAQDSIEDMFAKYETSNMHMFPDDISTASLKDVADVLVTLCGTSGLEFPCFGIPVITCGKSMYYDLGFTKTPTTLSEYKDMLLHIDECHKLNDEQVQLARKALYAFIQCFDISLDEWDDMLYTKLHIMENKSITPENIIQEMKEYNTDILGGLKDFTTKFPWKESEYYRRGTAVKRRIAELE